MKMSDDTQLAIVAKNLTKAKRCNFIGMVAVLMGVTGIIVCASLSKPLSIACAILTILGYATIESSNRFMKDEPISESELAFARKYDREYGERKTAEQRQATAQLINHLPCAVFQTEDPNSFDSKFLKLYGISMPQEE